MSVVKTVDRLGRVVIPMKWRRKWGSRVVLFRLGENEVLVKAMTGKGKLTDLIDSIPIGNVKDFTDTHELRKLLIG